jgi:chromosome segregation protein
MRIHKLEIQGFKSFADRMTLKFGDGITGVVGPNGCGKSNVVDALRWVMGEMSAKHLRGSSMQDVIFNGCETRGPMGMAEVTVTFENDGANIPIEYANYPFVEVTRRLYRDGESDYLINRTQCRLKDITELFLGTGIGTKAYSIIEQGQVSTLVKAKPEDRRRIIEEAAGITKYKARRQAAERKMDHTRHNLERVTDVIGEVSRRLGSLKRQARKAERYKQLKAEVRDIELRQAALAWLELSNGLGFDRDLARDESEQLVGHEARVAQHETSIEVERLKLLDDDARLAQAQAKLYELDNQISLAEQQGEHAVSSIEAGKKREQDAREEIAGLREALSIVLDTRSNLERGADDLVADAERVERELAEAVAALEVLTTERSQQTGDTEELRGRVLHGATRVAQTNSEIENLSEKDREIERRVEALTAELDEAESQRTERVAQIEAARSARTSAEAERSEREAERARALKSLEEQKVALEEATTKAHDEREVLGERKSRLASLEELYTSYERSPEGVRALMQREGNAERGVRGLVADLFEAPEGIERAVEAALGSRLQAIVVETPQAATDALDYLHDSQQGRAEVVVASALPASRAPAGVDGARSLFAELNVPEWHREVVQGLLGRTLLVERPEDAYARWSEARALGATLVTARGEVFSPDGVVRGGQEGDADASLLRQKRLIRELQDDVERLEQSLALVVERRDQLSRSVSELEAKSDHLAQEAHRLQLLEMEKKQELQRAEDDRSRLAQRCDDLTAEGTRRAEERARLAEDIARRREVLAEAEAARTDAERALQAVVDAQQSLDSRIAEQSESVTQLRVRNASHTERRENLRQSLEHHQKNERDVTERLSRLDAQIKETLSERERLEQVTVESKTKIEALVGERSAVKGALDRDREAYEAAAEQVRKLEGEAREARRTVDEVRTRLNDLSIRVRERELELDALEARTMDGYGVRPIDSIFDYHLLPLPAQEDVERVKEIRRQVDNMGEINLTAIEESKELEERYAFLKSQSDDLTHALTQLEKAIVKINRTTKKRFLEAYESINENFKKVFPRLFRGGKAWLALTDPNELLSTGVEIYAQPPGKKLSSVTMMSGGEQALTAVSLIFSIFLIKPSPFCLLDEVDAPLDEANVSRFNEMVKDVSNISQFIVITHNKRTMEMADQLYGVTMEEPGISKMVNVRMS